MKFAYYPGCSLHSTAKEYDDSTQAVCRALGIELEEIPDWNCCGASSAHATSHELAVALPARNLGIAEQMGLDVVVPCAACFNRMKSAEVAMKNGNGVAEAINAELEAKYTGRITVEPLVEPLARPEVIEKLSAMVRKPLCGLKVACYYGCLLVRPPKIMGFDDPEDPQSIDNIARALGAEPVEWYYKTECCGAGFSLTRVDMVHKMTHDILLRAKKAGAHAVVCACPLCQANLDMRQAEIEKIYGTTFDLPVFYITELVALAMDLPGTRGYFGKHMVDVASALEAIGAGEAAGAKEEASAAAGKS
ncbi:MAG: CoB--CoM heterodisulfide reductase iron-sulfur subunit B family protein [Armatimonadetes bacterium]|nr:CoB--CoM heterodisulfide reductase iron-sulfur subunit B family protein [Armatimonadota bacterium]